MTTTLTISTPKANRKELAEAFGQNQSAVRRIESMTQDITVNLPDAIGENGNIAQQALDLAQALQQVAYVLSSESSEVPNGNVLKQGAGVSITISTGAVTVALTVPVAVEYGGTGETEGGGAALDNVSGFLSTGIVRRVGAANYVLDAQSVYLLSANNLSDVASATAARANIGAAARGANSDITSLTGLTTPLAVSEGGTGSSTAAGARTALGAAASGANSDITSLTGLTTPLAVTEGGTGVATLTPYGVLVGNGGGPVGALAVGTLGQVLMSNGAGVNPSMQAIPNQPGKLLNVQTLTSSATYTKTAGTLSQIVLLQAPGGGGGGTSATGAAQSAAAAGGGAGSFAEVYFATAVTGVTVTLPAGAAGGAAGSNNGTAGSTATFGGYISCPGGAAGGAGSTASSAAITGASGRSSAPSVATVGGITPVALRLVPGSSGGVGLVANPGNSSMGGHGGQSPLYPAPYQDKAGSGSGINAGVPGEGGGGANEASASGAAQAGGTGGNACCIVFEFG